MTNDSATVAEKLKEKLHMKSKSSFEKFQEWSAKNIYLAGGFTGGFFLGIASSWYWILYWLKIQLWIVDPL